ncbi:helix-turn-helix transcriptional regulator [Pararhizobium qamdonense]|uniref:helix-turn-helix transcriptional regulator n=1 Tax=Pararhizobium qamdonense TaxID=3031126 RepID=UPI0023E1B98B|nr:helix-turn-helix transcriptional regulator [Pararhizobium qamdonense]
MIENLVDSFYEAAFLPEQWVEVLDRTSAATQSATGTLFVFEDNCPPRGRTSPAAQGLFEDFISGDFWKTCASVQRMCDTQPGSFVNVDDYLTADEIAQDPIRIRLRQAGIGSNLCTSIPLPSGELVMFVFQRWLSGGNHNEEAVRLLNALRPDMARAGLVAARLRMERARSTVEALNSMGLPAMTLNSGGRVLAANDLIAALSPLLEIAAFDQASLANPVLDGLFQECLAAVGKRRQSVVRSIPLPGLNGDPATVLHLIPLIRNARDLFGADILVAATTVKTSSLVPDPSILSALFDLSPAEARLATELTSGLTLQEAARRSNVTFKTARTYLERIFAKTGVHRQSELLVLLGNTAPLVQPLSRAK